MLEAADFDTVLFLFDCDYAAHAVTKGLMPGTKEVFAGSAREIIATGPNAGTVSGSPFTRSLIKYLKAGARRPHGYFVAELQVLFKVEPALEKQQPSRIVLGGHHWPLRLKSLDPNTDASPQAGFPTEDIRALLMISLREELVLDSRNQFRWADWLSESADPHEPIETDDVIKVENAFCGDSYQVLISMQIEIWARLPSDAAYIFNGFIRSGSLT